MDTLKDTGYGGLSLNPGVYPRANVSAVAVVSLADA